jgi:hypothetical protein
VSQSEEASVRPRWAAASAATLGRPKMTRAGLREGRGSRPAGPGRERKEVKTISLFFSLYKAILKPLPRDFEKKFKKKTKTIIT